MIPENLLNEVKEQVQNVLSHTQDITNPNVNQLLEDWVNNKSDIYHAFGDKLIHEMGQIEVDLSEETRNNKFNDFIYGVNSTWSSYHNPAFYEFMQAQREGFFENRVVSDWKVNDKVTLRAGMKLLKTFKYFWKTKDDIDHWQTKASRYIQDAKIKGVLCMSIHPLDFLSSSVNNLGWRSCHAMDGEYRAGTLSYIADSATIICYIKSAHDEILENFSPNIVWNNKKWRLLIERSESGNFLGAGRQYPMAIDEQVLDKIRIEYADLFNKGPFSRWHDDQIETYDYKNHQEDGRQLRYKYIPIRGALYRLNDIVKDCDNPLHYNDLLNSTCSLPLFSWSRYATTTPKFVVGHEVNCICCGINPIEQMAGDMMLCNECADRYYTPCALCGCHHPVDQMTWVDSLEDYVCSECVSEACSYCEECGELVPNDDIYWDDETGAYYCYDCYNELLDSRQENLDKEN